MTCSHSVLFLCCVSPLSRTDSPALLGGSKFVKLSLEHIPTSQLFQQVLSNAPAEHVTLAWIIRGIRQRSFGMIMLVLGLIAMVPGLSVIAGLLLATLGFQMMMAREAPVLPRFIALRSMPTHRIAWLVDRSIPLMRGLEKFIRPRWHTPFVATKRLIGFVVVILAITLFMPIPLSNIIPGALTMLVAFAYLEEDGLLLCIALGASIGSLAITTAEAWATLRETEFLLRL
jgi:hypothetical protein